MPDGFRGFYTDNAEGPAYATYVAEELVTFVERNFPAKRSRAGRCIGGLSMGGYGALRLALAHPDRYASANSHSGALLYGARNAIRDPSPLTPPSSGRSSGPRPAGSAHDLLALATRAKESGAASRAAARLRHRRPPARRQPGGARGADAARHCRTSTASSPAPTTGTTGTRTSATPWRSTRTSWASPPTALRTGRVECRRVPRPARASPDVPTFVRTLECRASRAQRKPHRSGKSRPGAGSRFQGKGCRERYAASGWVERYRPSMPRSISSMSTRRPATSYSPAPVGCDAGDGHPADPLALGLRAGRWWCRRRGRCRRRRAARGGRGSAGRA